MKQIFIALTLTFVLIPVHAATVEIGVRFERDIGGGNTNPSDAIDTFGSLPAGAVTGIGTELIELTLFNVAFSQRAGTTNSIGQALDVQAAILEPGVRGILAVFENGDFSHYDTFFGAGGLGNVRLNPSSSFNKEHITLGRVAGHAVLTDTIEFCSSCTAGYRQVGDAIVSTIPLPAAAPLTILALGTLLGFGRVSRVQ